MPWRKVRPRRTPEEAGEKRQVVVGARSVGAYVAVAEDGWVVPTSDSFYSQGDAKGPRQSGGIGGVADAGSPVDIGSHGELFIGGFRVCRRFDSPRGWC